MAYVIAEPCIGTKDTTCVDVCPVDCIHPRKDEPEYETVDKLYIDPDECIDCTTRRPVLQSIDRLVFWSEGVKARLQAVGWREADAPKHWHRSRRTVPAEVSPASLKTSVSEEGRRAG